jgi:hypothetical protein
MKTKVGLWIDHRKAIVVTVTDKGEEMGLIISRAEKQPRRSGDSPLKGPYEPYHVPPQDCTFNSSLTNYRNSLTDRVLPLRFEKTGSRR